MNAADLMTPDPVTATPRATVAEAWDVMRELEIRHLPVVESGALVGMLSDRDLARFDIVRVLEVEGAETLRHELATPVVKLMSSDVITVDPETGLQEIVELLVEHRIGAVPVVRSDTRGLVGIVSYIDVLRAFRDSLADE
jgi:acetoin utilization protein AcuB